MNLQYITDEQLKDELSRRGFCTSSLWHISDVKHHIEDFNNDLEVGEESERLPIPTDEECVTILDYAVGQFSDSSGIYDGILMSVQSFNS